MPDPKKHQSPVSPLTTRKTSKLVHNQEPFLNEESVIESNEDTNVPMEVEEVKPPEPVKDIMRYEPVLAPLIVKKYEGKFDEYGFYDGEGCAYFHGGIVYKGAFRGGKMHGSGTCLWSNGTVFVGDFIENVIVGQGAYSWPDGNTYDGGVCNGLRHGFGTFKSAKSKSYAGQWKNGKCHGKGIMYYDEAGDSYYDGDWFNNIKCGFGIRRFKNGNMYEGSWDENQRNGKGTMYWYDLGQEYSGNWVNGVKNGHGENIWYLKRVNNSQYPLRNHYVGDFLNGDRHGKGIFHYASGAVYDGQWKHNMKDGHGKFVFKNGCVFSGNFSDDRMVDFPELILSGMTTPDISQCCLPVKSPTSFRSGSVAAMSGDAVDAFIDIDIDDVLQDYKFDLEQRQEEVDNIARITLRFASQMKQMYKFYSCLGTDSSVDNTFVMSKFQFWQFLKDHQFHMHGYSLVEIDRCLDYRTKSIQDCFKQVFIRDFLTGLVKISCFLFENEFKGDPNVVSKCFVNVVSMFTSEAEVMINGNVFKSAEETQEIMVHINECLDIYFFFMKIYSQDRVEHSLTMRDVVFMYKELGLINDMFTSTALVKILAGKNKEEAYYNLDTEITALEFLEVLVASSSIFVTNGMIAKQLIAGQVEVLPVFELSTIKSIENLHDTYEIEANEVEKDVIVDDSHHSESVDNISSKSSGQSSQKVSQKNSKKVKTDGKKLEKESSFHNSTSKLKIEKKGSSIKADDSKIKSPSLSIKGDLHTHVSSEAAIQHNHSDVTTNILIKLNDIESEEDQEPFQHDSKNQSEILNTVKVQLSEESSTEDEDFDILKFNLFLSQYLFPAFQKRKVIDTAIQSRSEKGKSVHYVHTE